MKLSTLGAAAVAFGAYMYLKRNRPQQGMEDAAPAAMPDRQGGSDAAPYAGMPGTGAESPHIAERMQAAGMQATPSGNSPGLAGGTSADELSGSSSPQGPGPASAGMTDWTRGA